MTDRPRLTIPGVVKEGVRIVWELDAPFLRTVWWSVRRPHQLIWRYLSGDRDPFANPIKFCLILGGLMMIILLLVNPSEFRQMAETVDQSSSESASVLMEATFRVINVTHILYVLVLPMYALMSWLLFHRLRWTFAEHIVWTLYTFSGSFVVTAPLMPFYRYNLQIASLVTMVMSFVYFVAVARLSMRTPLFSTIIKTIVCYAAFLVVYVQAQWILIVLTAAWMLFVT